MSGARLDWNREELRRDVDVDGGAWDLPGVRQAVLAHIGEIEADLRALVEYKAGLAQTKGIKQWFDERLTLRAEKAEKERDALRAALTRLVDAIDAEFPEEGEGTHTKGLADAVEEARALLAMMGGRL